MEINYLKIKEFSVEENYIDFIKGDEESENLYGDYLKVESEINQFESKIEEISESVITRIDESLVADFDYSDESLESIENIIDDAFKYQENPDIALVEDMVIDLGSYLGLTIINNFGGQWRFRSDLIHSSVYFKSIESECFPYHRVARRLLFGKSESLVDFYTSLVQVLGADD